MTISQPEVWLPNISYPICTSFKPTIMEGQLCYKIQVNESSGQGKDNELLLLLDYQPELSLHVSSKPEDKQNRTKVRNLNTVGSLNTDSAKVHIDTLSSFVGFGGGIYEMTAVKRMTATDDFLKMPLKERSCKVERYQHCRTRKLLEGCKCVPWEMPLYQVLDRSYLKKLNTFP